MDRKAMNSIKKPTAFIMAVCIVLTMLTVGVFASDNWYKEVNNGQIEEEDNINATNNGVKLTGSGGNSASYTLNGNLTAGEDGVKVIANSKGKATLQTGNITAENGTGLGIEANVGEEGNLSTVTANVGDIKAGKGLNVTTSDYGSITVSAGNIESGETNLIQTNMNSINATIEPNPAPCAGSFFSSAIVLADFLL